MNRFINNIKHKLIVIKWLLFLDYTIFLIIGELIKECEYLLREKEKLKIILFGDLA